VSLSSRADSEIGPAAPAGDQDATGRYVGRRRIQAIVVLMKAVPTGAPVPTPYSAAQARTVTVALELFSTHGVAGTSLQMIADELGVTKAAVYHQFNTKDQIVLAAAEVELARLDGVIVAAESQSTSRRARTVLIEGIVDLTVERRRTVNTILSDPVVVGFFAEHATWRDVMQRLRRLLIGEDAGPEARVRTTMLVAAISGAATHPFVADLDDDVLRAELLRLARRFLGLPG
jgi:AcrR family transcriptional regulator